MALVSETIVREYFEQHGFFVRQQRKYIATNRREDDQADFLVLNPHAVSVPNPPFTLASIDLRGIARAVVVVKGWHTETFSPAVLANAPEIFRSFQPSAFQQAARAFGTTEPLTNILVVPALPQAGDALLGSIELLRAKGIDAVIPFRTMLGDLIANIEVNRNYQKSDLLQVLRILEKYDFFREPQLDFFRTKRRPTRKPAPE